MSQNIILVANATGKQGGGVVRQCLARGFHVVALVRDTGSSAAQELSKLGAELAQGHFDNTESLLSAMKNVDTVFFHEVRTKEPATDLQRVKNFIDAALASPNVTMVIATTASKTGQHESFPGWGPSHPMYVYWSQKHAIENLVRNASFQRWTIIRPAHFLQNTLPPANAFMYPGFTKGLTLRVAYKPETRISLVDCTDVGVAAADAMSSPSKFAGREIEFAAEAITIEEFAGKIGQVLGSEVKVHYYLEEEIAQAGGTKNAAIAASKWANDVPSEDAAEAAKEFTMTSVSSFLEKHKGAILGKA